MVLAAAAVCNIEQNHSTITTIELFFFMHVLFLMGLLLIKASDEELRKSERKDRFRKFLSQ
jgi:hypothetical protein